MNQTVIEIIVQKMYEYKKTKNNYLGLMMWRVIKKY